MSEEEEMVAHFSGTCRICGKYVDGRRHNVNWSPVKGLSHATCVSAK